MQKEGGEKKKKKKKKRKRKKKGPSTGLKSFNNSSSLKCVFSEIFVFLRIAFLPFPDSAMGSASSSNLLIFY